MVTSRRTPVARGAASRSAPAHSSGFRGAEGRRKMEEEQQRAAARKEAQAQMSGMPFRFYCPPGESREVVVVDVEPDFFRYEHNLKNTQSGKWDIFTACINEHANCPVCKQAERPPYFAMYLTIIDLEPYTNREGIEVPWSKKLLVVKPQQQKKLMRIYEREGSLRGVVLQMTRDGEKDASIGNDIEVVEVMSEDDLLTYETVYTDKNGKEHDVIGHEPFDYDELFPAPTEESLRAIVGGAPEPGSRAADRRALRGREDAGSGDGWDGEEGRPAVRRRAPASAAPAPAARRPLARRAAEPDDVADDVVDDQDAGEVAETRRAPVRRSAASSERAAPAPRRPMRSAEPDDGPQRPVAGGQSLAERRRALRR